VELVKTVRQAADGPTLRCTTWPCCRCGEAWEFWTDELARFNDPELSPPAADEVAAAKRGLEQMLGCVAANCGDPLLSAKCERQLYAIREMEL
jgi:hypothetical protein